MKDGSGTLWALAGGFALLSLFAVGGANSTVPEMHRLTVDLHHWLSGREFTDLFALAQVAPGPNIIFVTLIGYHVAGIPGALVATVAMVTPTCLLAYAVGRALDHSTGAWQATLRRGLVPVMVGLTAATAAVVARAADTSVAAAGLTALSFAIFYWFRLNPLYVFGAAALIGLTGLV